MPPRSQRSTKASPARNNDWSQKHDQSPVLPYGVGVMAIIAAGLISRPAATSIGPILSELKTGLELSATSAGLLTALPGFCFAVIGLIANKLPAKFGLLGSLIQAAALMVLGMALRSFTGSWQLFLVFSFIALAGMAVGNVLVPVFIKSAFPGRTARMTTIFTTSLAMGQMLPTILTSPIERAGTAWQGPSFGWRLAVGIWTIFAVLSLVLWVAVQKWSTLVDPTKTTDPPSTQADISTKITVRELWHSPTAVGLMLFFGMQSMHAYLQFGWLPQIFRDGGLDPTRAGLTVTIIALGGVLAGLLMPRIINRGRFLPAWIVGFSVLSASGYLGIAFVPTVFPWLWATALSIAGFAFATSLALIVERTDHPSVTSAVSGFVQPMGYFMAALGPFLVGLAYDAIGNWLPILLVLAASSVFLCISGLMAIRPRLIDNEIGHKPLLENSNFARGE